MEAGKNWLINSIICIHENDEAWIMHEEMEFDFSFKYLICNFT